MLLAAALAIASAASAADPAPSVTKARNSAVGYALTLDRVTDSFAKKCGGVSRESARLARAGWSERNRDMVQSADRYLEFVQRLLVQTRGEEAARRFYEEQKSAFAQRAQLAVIDRMLSGAGEREVCEQVLHAIATGGMDVVASPAHRHALEEIRAELPAPGK